ncbi:CDP-diacylglycerol--serine O-phosphatidyltransferase [bacterium]|nr:CDP-diacylglycerol--serine O-phosphatidyltransferase [bacterium]
MACGFFALTWIFKYEPGSGDFEPIRVAIRLILAAFAFDFFDGRVARVTRRESPFGREFDSLADIVSFGVAPAFLVYRIVLSEFERTGWLVAAVYLVCGGIRLARFNILSQTKAPGSKNEFFGFPIPSAAAMVVSVTMFIMWLEGHDGRELGMVARYSLCGLMLLLSILMVSNLRYPNFKNVEWNLQRSVAVFSAIVVVALLLAAHFEVTLAGLFVAYMLYGLVRPWVSKRWRSEIEDDDSEDNDAA